MDVWRMHSLKEDRVFGRSFWVHNGSIIYFELKLHSPLRCSDTSGGFGHKDEFRGLLLKALKKVDSIKFITFKKHIRKRADIDLPFFYF